MEGVVIESPQIHCIFKSTIYWSHLRTNHSQTKWCRPIHEPWEGGGLKLARVTILLRKAFWLVASTLSAAIAAKHCQKKSPVIRASRASIEGNCENGRSQCSLQYRREDSGAGGILQWISQIFRWHSKTGTSCIKLYLCTLVLHVNRYHSSLN